MKLTACHESVLAAFDCLGIHYRGYPCKGGTLYFCTIPASGLTFDLKYREDGTIKLWRFVGTAPVSKPAVKYEYRRPGAPCSAVGIEITDDGDISLYAEQTIDENDADRNARIKRIISGYVKITQDFIYTM